MGSRGETRVGTALLCTVTASALILSAAGGADPAASASKKRKAGPAVMTRTAVGTTTRDKQLLTVTATCPKRSTLVGGGFSSGVLASGSLAELHVVYEDHRLDRRRWNVSGARRDGDSSGNPLDLSAFARCRAGKEPELTEASAGVPLLGGFLTTATTTASCPGKKKAISGGFTLTPAPFVQTPDPGVILISENRRTSARSWTATAAQFSPTQRTLIVFAYCASGKVPKARSATVFLPGNTFATAAADTPPCPRRTRLASGGLLTAVPSMTGSVGLFISSSPTGSSWHSLAIQSTSGTGAEVTTSGYCI